MNVSKWIIRIFGYGLGCFGIIACIITGKPWHMYLIFVSVMIITYFSTKDY